MTPEAEQNATFREQLIKKAMRDCRHFNGIQHDCCEAGVNYDALREGEKYALPCLKNFVNLSKLDPARCEKFAAMTQAEAEKDADEMLSRQEKTLLAVHAAHADATLKRFGIGQGGADSMPCPTGCGGRLYYRVASVNGHMHARCETKGCVSWME